MSTKIVCVSRSERVANANELVSNIPYKLVSNKSAEHVTESNSEFLTPSTRNAHGQMQCLQYIPEVNAPICPVTNHNVSHFIKFIKYSMVSILPKCPDVMF